MLLCLSDASDIFILQSIAQMIFTSLGLAQHFCVIDFLVELPILIYLRVLYFHRPDSCGNRINIGNAIDGIANQAFVLLTTEPFTAFRTFVINCTSLGLSVLWMIVSVIIIMGGAKDNKSKHARWPWIIVTVAVCILDLVATVTYANDSFHTRTLSDSMDFIGGTVSGIGSVELNTSWAAWTMVLLNSRLVVVFVMNVFLVVMLTVECNVKRDTRENVSVQVESPVQVMVTAVQTSDSSSEPRDVEEASTPSVLRTAARIPRPGLSQSFRRMKTLLFRRTPTPEPRNKSPDTSDSSPDRSPQTQHVEMEKKRTVNFPENLLSLPQRLENMIAEQQRRLDQAIIDTSGKRTPPRTSQSLPQLVESSSTNLTDSKGRRGTTAELQGQMPWAYIPASSKPMRDQLPPDEDLPPVPLPDYTAIPSFRKTSVHRAASSLSSLTQKRDYTSQTTRPALTQSDVLY